MLLDRGATKCPAGRADRRRGGRRGSTGWAGQRARGSIPVAARGRTCGEEGVRRGRHRFRYFRGAHACIRGSGRPRGGDHSRRGGRSGPAKPRRHAVAGGDRRGRSVRPAPTAACHRRSHDHHLRCDRGPTVSARSFNPVTRRAPDRRRTRGQARLSVRRSAVAFIGTDNEVLDKDSITVARRDRECGVRARGQV